MKRNTNALQIAKSFFDATPPVNTSVDDWLEAVRVIVSAIAQATDTPVENISGFINATACASDATADCTALLLCESIVEEGPTSTLSRLQESVTTPSLPHTCSSLWAFARIAHCHGPTTLVLEVASPSSDEMMPVNDTLVAPNDDGVITWHCNLEGLELTEPGKHMFSLEANGVRVALYWYEVVVQPVDEAVKA